MVREDVGNTTENSIISLSLTQNVLGAISKGLQAIKLCCNKNPKFWTGGAG